MYQKRKSRIIKHIDFLICDLLVLSIAFYISNLFRHGWNALHMNEDYKLILGIFLLFWLFEAIFFEFYQDILRRGKLVEFKNVIVQTSIVMVSVFTFMFVTKTQENYSRMVFGVLWLVGNIMLYVERLLWKHIVRNKFTNSEERAHLLIVSNASSLGKNIRCLQRKKYQSYVISGVVAYDKKMEGSKIANIPIVANWENIFEYVQKAVVDEVYLDVPFENSEHSEIIERFLEMGITVHVNLDLENVTLPNKVVQDMGGGYVLTTSIKTASRYQIFMKRMMDILGSILGLAITGLLCVILGPIIYVQSPGPIFFSQTRIGKNGRHFQIYKFRSMYMDAEERKKELMAQNKMNGFMFKMDDDPRIFPAGKFMRKYSLDEFPQFWNVLKGDMSLVGTRPPTVDEFEQYEAHHKVRLAIKPGLTGMWQVSGRSDITDFEEVVALDNQYIVNWNLRLDIKILFKTIAVVLGSKGSV